MRFARRSVLALALGLALVVPTAAQQTAPTAGRSIKTLAGAKALARNGQPILLGSRIRPRKPTLISIWATWCQPCIAEAPYLNRIRRESGDRINFLYINLSDGIPDPNQPPAAIAQFLARTGMSDVNYLTVDVKAYRQILGADRATIPDSLVGIPRVYIFDRNGRQIYTRLGFRAAEGRRLEQRVRQAIAE